MPPPTPDAVAERWTRRLSDARAVADHLDVRSGEGTLYRVFLLADSLQVDVSFWPEDRFRGTEAGFRLLFGSANAPTQPRPPSAQTLVGMTWLYALHARSAIARGRGWQAVMMLDHVRDAVISLAALRLGLNPHDGRDADRLPASLRAALADARAASIDPAELRRANATTIDVMLDEVRQHDPARAERLAGPASVLAGR